MISKDKKYQTRLKREVRIYALDGSSGGEVHGAFKEEHGWRPWTWNLKGESITREDWICRQFNENYQSEFDLVEVDLETSNEY